MPLPVDSALKTALQDEIVVLPQGMLSPTAPRFLAGLAARLEDDLQLLQTTSPDHHPEGQSRRCPNLRGPTLTRRGVELSGSSPAHVREG